MAETRIAYTILSGESYAVVQSPAAPAITILHRGMQGPPGVTQEAPTFSQAGNLAVKVGAGRYVVGPGTWQISSINASVGGAPVGASVIVDINKNGTTIFATQANRPTIASTQHDAIVGAASTTSVLAGDYLTVDVDQVGSTTAGSDLVVVIRLTKTS